MSNEKWLIDIKQIIAEMNQVDTNSPCYDKEDILEACVNLLHTAPTVDAVEVVRGRWITDEKGKTYCNRCRVIDDYASVHNYCPFCGANMKGENNNG